MVPLDMLFLLRSCFSLHTEGFELTKNFFFLQLVLDSDTRYSCCFFITELRNSVRTPTSAQNDEQELQLNRKNYKCYIKNFKQVSFAILCRFMTQLLLFFIHLNLKIDSRKLFR